MVAWRASPTRKGFFGLNILYLSQRLPYPPDRGDRIPVYHHVRQLGLRHRVHVASLISGPAEAASVKALQAMTASVTVATQSRWSSLWGMVWALLRGRSLSIGYFRNGRLAGEIHRLMVSGEIDAVVIFSSSMAPYVDGFSDRIRIMNFCDVDSRKWADLAATVPFPRSWIYRREAKTLARYERSVAGRFSDCCFVTEGEAALFRSVMPEARPEVVPNGVDHQKFGAVKRAPQGLKFALVGVMDYEPNVEAAIFFAREVFPRLRKQWPEAEFQVVGARPSPEVKALSALPGVLVTGYVDDVRDYLATATLVVIPLAVARGIQNKVLEALAAAVPVLASKPVAESLGNHLRECLYVADRTAEGFYAGVQAALTEAPETRQAKAEKAQAILRREATWEASAAKLEAMILGAKSRAEQ